MSSSLSQDNNNAECEVHYGSILNYWNTVELFALFDLTEALKKDEEETYSSANADNTITKDDTMPWCVDHNREENKYTVFLGVMAQKEIATVLNLQGDCSDGWNLDHLTCVGKISLEEEQGFTRLDYVGLSSLNWAITKYTANQPILTSEFREYRENLLKYAREVICPEIMKKSLQDIPGKFLHRIYQTFLMLNPSRSKTSVDLWAPENARFLIIKHPRTHESHFARILKERFSVKEDQIKEATKVFKGYLKEKFRNESIENKSFGDLVSLLKSFKTRNDFSSIPIDADFLEQAIEKIFKVRNIEILNSYYMEDLASAQEFVKSSGTSLLKSYLNRTNNYIDLFDPSAKETILENTSPSRTPLGRWPYNPAFSQSLMQQFAINKTLQQSNNGLFSVNGPPGTGKTTLAKEVIAEVLVNRAAELAKLRVAQDAFDKSRQLQFNGRNFFPLKPTLTGHEILVASTNNTAVENLTKELPSLAHIHNEFQNDISYLRSLAPLFDQEESKSESPRFGLFAIPLGNKSNNDNFLNKISPRKETSRSPRKIAHHADEISFNDWLEHSDPNQIPFEKAKGLFLAAKDRVLAEIEKLDDAYQIYKGLKKSRLDWEQVQPAKHAAKCRWHRLQSKDTELRASLEELHLLYNSIPDEGVFEKLICLLWPMGTRRTKRALFDKRLELQEEIVDCLKERKEVEAIIKEFESVEAQYEEAESQFNALEDNIKLHCEKLTLDLDEPSFQSTTPLQTEKLNRLRSQLFVSALGLHEAWLEEVKSQPSLKTLIYQIRSVFWNGNISQADAAEALWQILFFLFPVISTTFASAGNLFKRIRPHTFGLLIIDEAGQSVPQAAVGTLLRCKKALVVGDPLQLEPIISLPLPISTKLYDDFSQNAAGLEFYAPHKNSVQSLADRSHTFGGLIGHEKRVGCPLRVHRRCAEPMFELANSIAYEGKMIQGNQSAIVPHDDLGQSRWVHVTGNAVGNRGHWVKEQGDCVLEMISSLNRNVETKSYDKVFVISPFREVVSEFRKAAKAVRKQLEPKFPKISSWLRDSVGTVHQFQGKEADIVFIILGLDPESRFSARAIVGDKPNLLNVAATRARKHIYIVGDANIWKDVYGFETAYSLLGPQPIKKRFRASSPEAYPQVP